MRSKQMGEANAVGMAGISRDESWRSARLRQMRSRSGDDRRSRGWNLRAAEDCSVRRHQCVMCVAPKSVVLADDDDQGVADERSGCPNDP